MATTTRGTWRLDQAVFRHWLAQGLDREFRKEWVDSTATEYQTLHDQMARPVPPGPYCVFEKGDIEIVTRMTGSSDVNDEKQILRWPFSFRIHARDRAGETAKQIGVRLAKKVVAAFDPHQSIEIDDATHVLTLRGPDWHEQEGFDECVWILEYQWLIDCSLIQWQSEGGTVEPTIPDKEELDDVLDFGDIGGVYGGAEYAVANTAALVAYLATRANKGVFLTFRGPVTYENKREPQDAYLDISSTIQLNVGGSGQITDLEFFGPSKIIGVGADSDTTPVFTINRAAGAVPNVLFKKMVLQSNGSGIRINNGGSGVSLENVIIDSFDGDGTLDYENWTDVTGETCGYGIWVDDADGLRMKGVVIREGAGHGLVIERLHAGDIQVRIHNCGGTGAKVQKCNGTKANFWIESCDGYGLHARDTGINRYASSAKAANDGGPSDWWCWFEANNGRGTSYSSSGYNFSQFKFDNVARVRMTGHSGWRVNQARLNRYDRVRNELVEDRYTTISTTADLELITSNVISDDYEAPDATNSNWATVWPDSDYRPTVAVVGAGTANDPNRVRITWPALCFDSAALSTAYWRMFNTAALNAPATFFWEAEVSDVDGNIAAYCIAREAASNRQLNVCGGFTIDPVAGSITYFPLWDTNHRKFTGEIEVTDTRSDIQPAFNVFTPGMQDQEGNATQNAQHRLDIHQLRMYRIT